MTMGESAPTTTSWPAGDRGQSDGLRVNARDVGRVTRDGQEMLRGVSPTVRRGELVAIIGSSGSGKTTLLDVLAGLRAPSGGIGRHDGVDCHQRAAIAGAVGYVPQDDIVHRDMPLGRTLRCAAQLRLPTETPAVLSARTGPRSRR